MKNPKKPTRSQKIFLSSKRMIADNWLIINDTSDEMIIINKKSGKKRVLHK